MKTHDLTQGSAEWLAYRATHFNASDAPAMMGESPYKTRSELLHEMYTGLTAEIDAATQQRFDDGHRFEALARPLAETIVGEDLYPVTGSEGKLSASFDGITIDEQTVFEHKTLNAELLRSMPNDDDTPLDRNFPAVYRIQMEQQLMVSFASRCLFMASRWNGDDLVEERHAWYYPDHDLRMEILQGWTQFAIDLDNYTPVEATVKPAANAVTALPAVTVQVSGAISIINNMPAFEVALRDFIDNRLILKPETDQEFADLESQIKALKNAEVALDAAEAQMLSQVESVDAAKRMKDMLHKLTRDNRLMAEKLLAARKDSIRAEIVADGRNAIADHLASLNGRIGNSYMPPLSVDFAGSIKGKRTLDSMRDAVATELARAKIEANATADKITLNLRAVHDQTDFVFLFADVATLVLKDPEFVAMAIKNRVADHRAKEAARIEAERTRIAAEEQAKAQAAERARADAEIAAATAKARAQAHAQAQADSEAKRASDEAIARAREQDYMAKIDASRMRHNASGQPPEAPVCEIAQTENEVGTANPLSPPTLRLGQICERLGFTMTADFMRHLGFEPAATDKAAKLYHENDFPRICAVLVRHINSVCQLQAA